MQLLESLIIQKSESINIVTTSLDSYHNAISNHIIEVLCSLICMIQYLKSILHNKIYLINYNNINCLL